MGAVRAFVVLPRDRSIFVGGWLLPSAAAFVALAGAWSGSGLVATFGVCALVGSIARESRAARSRERSRYAAAFSLLASQQRPSDGSSGSGPSSAGWAVSPK